MYKKILVPLDSSTRSEAILPHVEELALASQAEVLLLGVVEGIPMPLVEGMSVDSSFQAYKHQTKELDRYLTTKRDALRQKNIPTEAQVGHGAIVETIINCAEEQAVDLIAMASHGRTGMSQAFYGSVASAVLHRVQHPLLLVRSL